MRRDGALSSVARQTVVRQIRNASAWLMALPQSRLEMVIRKGFGKATLLPIGRKSTDDFDPRGPVERPKRQKPVASLT
jgi:hypothetical protein